MDFKVAGTEKGITALQMDIKFDGLSRDIMEHALKQAHTARLHILENMYAVLPTHRASVSEHAPKVILFQIKPDKIREVIGKGGAVIKDLCERYSVTIDISEQGQIKIGAVNGQKGEEAQKHIMSIVKEIEVGDTYEGQVTKIMDFGAFISLKPGKDGFLHISEISDAHVADINEHLKRGQTVTVKVLEIDPQQRIRVTMRQSNKK
jgi:polyribonucleotide nucleotidyltransferase